MNRIRTVNLNGVNNTEDLFINYYNRKGHPDRPGKCVTVGKPATGYGTFDSMTGPKEQVHSAYSPFL